MLVPSPIVLGVAALAAASWLLALSIALRRLVFLRRAERAVGTVVAIEEIDDGGAYPVVAFETRGGVSMKLRSGLSGQKGAELGRQVNVLYEPGDPSEAMIEARETIWFLPVFFVLFGAAFALLAVVVALLW